MTIFTQIINGDIPSYKVAEDDNYYAFLDINPLQPGHTLVIPKLPEPEQDYIFRLDDDTYSGLMLFAKRVAQAIQAATDCKRVGMAVLGMEVNHVHVHLVPLNKESDMLFSNPKLKLSAEEMGEIANTIAEAMETID
ncbi:MAG: HIT family protein [Paludibacteraceae bacterium]|nr:HIT family protein [Paludibacteraceae bacterium]